jgi:type I restriction-modification system DNA methylase subunit
MYTLVLAPSRSVFNKYAEVLPAQIHITATHTTVTADLAMLANPPFNVYDVELDQVKPQPHFNTYGVPQNKTKKAKDDAKQTVPNGNYLRIITNALDKQ